MTEMKSYPPGDFSWTELTTSDDAAARKFYTALFGWKPDAIPMGPNVPPYVMLLKKGKRVAALYENKKAPPHWTSYVSVANADQAAKKAKSLGAKVVAEPFDVMDAGRMATIQDPQGATFCLWQAKSHIGAEVINEPDTMCWNELYTPDIEASRTFYASLFKWKMKISPGYTEAHVGDKATAGMIEITGQMKGMPPNWMPYFAVSDCDATVKKAKSQGAKVHVEPRDIPEVGRFSVIGDPQGAGFAVIKLKQR